MIGSEVIVPAGMNGAAYLAGWNASAAIRARQGLPPTIEDPVAIAEIVEILRSCPLPRDVEGADLCAACWGEAS